LRETPSTESPQVNQLGEVLHLLCDECYYK
jgi:hypothetical protein